MGRRQIGEGPVGHCKDLTLIVSEMGTLSEVVSRGVTCPDLHFKRTSWLSTENGLWRLGRRWARVNQEAIAEM